MMEVQIFRVQQVLGVIPKWAKNELSLSLWMDLDNPVQAFVKPGKKKNSSYRKRAPFELVYNL